MDGELDEKFLKYDGTDRGLFICITYDKIGAIFLYVKMLMGA